MNEWFATLLELSPPPSELIGVPKATDWLATENRFGPLPSDYIDFITAYGEGYFADEICIAVPQHLNDLLTRGDLTDLRRMLIENNQIDFTFAIFPESNEGLLAVGVDTYSSVIAWDRSGAPDNWTIVFVGIHDFQRFDMGLVEFLVKILRNEVQCRWWGHFDDTSFSTG